MVVHQAFPVLETIVRGQTAKINLDVQDLVGADRDWTGAAVSVEFFHTIGSFTKTGTLDGTPNAGPQASVTLVPADTAGLTVPQVMTVVVTTTLAGGAVDKARFKLPLVFP